MQTPLNRFGRVLTAAFMAFALTALADGALSVAAMPTPPVAAAAVAIQA